MLIGVWIRYCHTGGTQFLFKNKTYFLLIGNKAEVLELQGKKDETKKYWTEANLFKSLFETLDQKNDNI